MVCFHARLLQQQLFPIIDVLSFTGILTTISGSAALTSIWPREQSTEELELRRREGICAQKSELKRRPEAANLAPYRWTFA